MRTEHQHTESDLRQAMNDLAGTARTPEAVQTRLAARRHRRTAPRMAAFLAVAATLVVAAAIAVPLILGPRAEDRSATGAAGGPVGRSLMWTFSHSFELPPDWRIRIRRVTATTEVTILATPAVGPMTRQCRFTVQRTDTRTPPSGPAVDVNGQPGTTYAADGMVTVHWVLGDGSRASVSCADTESALLLARAVNDVPETITLPYRFTRFADDFTPTSLAVEYADDQTTITVVLNSPAVAADLTIVASSLGIGETSVSSAERVTVAGTDAALDPVRRELTFNVNGQGLTMRLGDTEPTTPPGRSRDLLIAAAETLDVADGSYDADIALTP